MKEEALVSWVEKHTDELRIRHFETDVHPELKELTDLRFFRTTMECFGRTFGGYGTAADPELALLKSISECIERAAAIGHFQLRDSSGCACHFDPGLAREAACLELIERDAFFAHFLTRTPFTLLEESAFGTNGAKLSFFRMESAVSGVHTILCQLTWPYPVGPRYVLSAAAGRDLADVKKKSLQENLSLTNNFLYHTGLLTDGKEMEALAARGGFVPADHAKLFFSPEHAADFEAQYLRPHDGIVAEAVAGLPDARELDLRNSIFESSGVSLWAASGEMFQRAFWGFPPRELVNVARLKKWKPDLRDDDIAWNKLHLFG